MDMTAIHIYNVYRYVINCSMKLNLFINKIRALA